MPKKLIKISIDIISEYDEDFIEFVIIIKKSGPENLIKILNRINPILLKEKK